MSDAEQDAADPDHANLGDVAQNVRRHIADITILFQARGSASFCIAKYMIFTTEYNLPSSFDSPVP